MSGIGQEGLKNYTKVSRSNPKIKKNYKLSRHNPRRAIRIRKKHDILVRWRNVLRNKVERRRKSKKRFKLKKA